MLFTVDFWSINMAGDTLGGSHCVWGCLVFFLDDLFWGFGGKNVNKMDAEKKTRVLARFLQESVLAPNGQCRLWTGAAQRNKNVQYGVLNLKLGPGRWKRYYVHRLAYMAHYDTYNLEVEHRDCSHVCHNTLCINPEHISYEEHWINNNRQSCRNKGFCVGHGGLAACLLHLEIHG